ncbi:MAG TPA: ATP-dependent Clp protease ATP-binding subunit [Candidatus Paceibacterota bacterium]
MPNKSVVYFKNYLLDMRPLTRAFIRMTIGIWMIVLTILTLVLLLSDIEPLYWSGTIVLLYLIDRLIHRNDGDRRISRMPPTGRINIAEYMTPASLKAIIGAHDKTYLENGNILLYLTSILIDDRGVREAFLRLGIKEDEFRVKLDEYLNVHKVEERESEEVVSRNISIISIKALEQAIAGQDEYIDPVDLFGALGFMENKDLSRIFELFNIKPGDVEKSLIFGRVKKRGSWISGLPKTVGGFARRHMRHRVMNRAWTSRPTPNLDRFSADLTDVARSGGLGFMIGHEDEYNRLLNILTRPVKPNALLVGEPGIGKEVIVGHLAYMITKDKVPEQLFDKRLVALDVASIVAGAEQSEMQERIKIIFDEIYKAGNIILYIPEVHNLSRTSGAKQISAANAIVPLIVSNNFPLIGTTYPREYKVFIEQDSAFSSAFDIIRVKESTLDEAEKVLAYESVLFEKQFRIKITFEAIKTAVHLANKYFHNRPLPGSASDLLKEAISAEARSKGELVDGEDIVRVAEARVNIPIKKAGREEVEKLLNLEELIHKELINQENAVKLVAESLREYRSGLSRKGGPIGSFLFVGPTGVGKTELSKILTKLQFGSESAMVRFDMSEYQDKQSFFQLIGSPDGTVTGALTERVIEKPYSLILLDEFEKAHPDILNLFLQVFDDGRLTDNLGRVVNFENTIIIATSNAHSDFIKNEIESGRDMVEISGELKKKLVTFFKPELLNRFSAIVVFTSLNRDHIRQITKLQLDSLIKKLKDEQGIYISITDALINKIAEWGYDPVFGARPLRQVISSKIKTPLSKTILNQDSVRGLSLSMDLDGEEVKIG